VSFLNPFLWGQGFELELDFCTPIDQCFPGDYLHQRLETAYCQTTLQEPAMPRAKKTWGEKMNAKPPHHVILEKDFAGIPKGAKLLISCPVEIAAELKTITPGSTMSIQAFRRKLAAKNNCDATCPVSTSIFLRIVTEHAWEEYGRTGSTRDLAPFWRVVESSSAMAKKLSFDPAWIDLQRELES
jgi:hypothetical protein